MLTSNWTVKGLSKLKWVSILEPESLRPRVKLGHGYPRQECLWKKLIIPGPAKVSQPSHKQS